MISTQVIVFGVLYLRFKRNEHKHRTERKRTTTLVIAQLVLLILFLSYTSTSTTIFRAFRPCDQLDENYHGSDSYMHDDYSVSCKSARRVFILAYAALMVLVYPVGIPLVSFCLMWRHREQLNPKLDSDFLQKDRKFEEVGESDSAFRRARHRLLFLHHGFLHRAAAGRRGRLLHRTGRRSHRLLRATHGLLRGALLLLRAARRRTILGRRHVALRRVVGALQFETESARSKSIFTEIAIFTRF